MALIDFRRGTAAKFAELTPSANSVYFTTDTHQLYVGSNEYTKSTKVLLSQPTTSTVGDPGRLYAYNGSLYLCTGEENGEWQYVRVANVNDVAGTVTSVGIGEGLTDANGGSTAITSTGTIKHAVPTGAEVTTDSLTDQTPDFGDTFDIVGVATDKFGHVTGVTTHTVTIPEETAVTVETATGTATTLSPGGTFTVVTEVEAGTADQSVKRTATTFTLPDDSDTTYTVSSTTEGQVTLTPSSGSSQTVTINGWSDLAKKADITAVFKFKGTKATAAELPAVADVGDVWAVTADNSEYVCTVAGTADPAVAATWEKLGPTIDLSAYALSADVIQRVTGETGEVPKFKEDGTVESTGFTLGCSVPADAVFTDTTYDVATSSTDGLMSSSDFTKLSGIESGAQVNTITGVKGDAESSYRTGDVNITLANLGVTVSASDVDSVTDKLDKTGGTITGDLTVSGSLHATADQATADASGNTITTTYATKTELTTALSWIEF